MASSPSSRRSTPAAAPLSLQRREAEAALGLGNGSERRMAGRREREREGDKARMGGLAVYWRW